MNEAALINKPQARGRRGDPALPRRQALAQRGGLPTGPSSGDRLGAVAHSGTRPPPALAPALLALPVSKQGCGAERASRKPSGRPGCSKWIAN